MEEIVNQRIADVIKWSAMSQRKFAETIDISQMIISSLFTRGSKPSCEMMRKIVKAFPQIDARWLLTGEGTMLTDTPVKVNANEIPILPYYAQGGAMNEFVQSVTPERCDTMISPLQEAQLAVPIVGDSMYPDFPNGSVVLVRKIEDNAFIEWGKSYVLDTCNGAVCKILVPSSNENRLKCISVNKDEMYAPFEVDRTDIYGIYKVLMCIIKK